MKKHNTKNFTIHDSRFTTCLPARQVHHSHGFTITELMVAIVISAIAMAAVYSTFIVQQRSFIVQDQVAETEVSSKIGFDMLVNDIREAGFGYPDDENPVNGFPEAINVTDSGINNGPDTLTLVGGFRQIATLRNATTIGSNQITINYIGSTQFNSTNAPLSNRSNLSIEGLTFATITNCTIVVGNCSEAAAITLDRDMNNSIPADRPVYLVEDVTYQIVTATGSNCGNAPAGTTCLTKTVAGGGTGNVDTIANNIDDLQFAYGVDTNDDGLIDTYKNIPLSTDKVINIRTSVLARTANEDQTLAPSTKPYFATGITLENNNTADTDRRRRRIWSMDVALRNPR